ncbi:MAG: hypothetical protein CL878_13940 [Dehalococcoidia bacterium]|nr:hypothetical protein [Dehalococcoidia bacterium]
MTEPDRDGERTAVAGAHPTSVDDAGLARRVARNTAGPLAASVIERGLGLLLASYAAKVLGPLGVGAYAVAQNVWLFASILADFGLGTLLTREVARDRPAAAELTASTVGLRLALATACAPAAVLVATIYGDRAILITVGLLAAGFFPTAIAGALSAVFAGYERMTTPAAVQLVTGVLTAGLGFAVLSLGWGIVGLGAVSLAVSALTAAAFLWLVRRTYFAPRVALVPRDLRAQLREAWPLMLNALLNTIFFRSDIQVLEALRGRRAVGHYGIAFRIVDAVGILPSRFVLALFPALSQRSAAGDASFLVVYRLAVKLLLGLAAPIAIGITVLAHDLTLLISDARYLPDSAVALQILVWYVPGSFWNGLTQYVLIAVGQQRWITLGFFLATTFNVAANLLLVPRYGLVAAAWTTVASEVVLFVPFAVTVRRSLGTLPLWREALVPLIGGLASAAVALGLSRLDSPSLAVAFAALLVYAVAWLALRPLDREEWELLAGLWRRSGTRSEPDAAAG